MSKKPSQRRGKTPPAAKSVPQQAPPAVSQELAEQASHPVSQELAEQASHPVSHELEQQGSHTLSQALEPQADRPVPQALESQEVPPHVMQEQPATPPPAPAASKPAHRPASAPGRLHDNQPDNQSDSQSDIRGVLIQLAGARLLLPNATIAEVLSYAPPEPVEAAPEWLLGMMRWRGWQLPLVAFAELAGIGKEPAGLGSKVVVLKALGGNAQAPYFAILSQGFPRLVTVSQQGLRAEPDSAGLPLGVHSRVRLNEDTAFVPDLEAVELLVNGALAQAA